MDGWVGAAAKVRASAEGLRSCGRLAWFLRSSLTSDCCLCACRCVQVAAVVEPVVRRTLQGAVLGRLWDFTPMELPAPRQEQPQS